MKIKSIFIVLLVLLSLSGYGQNLCRSWYEASFDAKHNKIKLTAKKKLIVDFHASGSVIFWDTKDDNGKFGKWKYNMERKLYVVTDCETHDTTDFELRQAGDQTYLYCPSYRKGGARYFIAISENAPYICPTYDSVCF